MYLIPIICPLCYLVLFVMLISVCCEVTFKTRRGFTLLHSLKC